MTLDSPDSELTQSQKIVEGKRLQRLQELTKRYPKLVAVAHTKEAVNRISEQYGLDRSIANPKEWPIGTYGINAPTYRKVIESILKEGSVRPRILILGAETPGAVRQVVNFTEKYNPVDIYLADKSQESIDLAIAYGQPVEGIVSDFMDKESSKKIPEYDIALGDKLLGYLLHGETEEEDIELATTFLENVSQNLSSRGAIILIDHARSWDREKHFFENMDKINAILVTKGIKVSDFGFVTEFTEMPDYDFLKTETYPNSKAKENSSLRCTVIQKIE